jgi:hypothetical protein
MRGASALLMSRYPAGQRHVAGMQQEKRLGTSENFVILSAWSSGIMNPSIRKRTQ